MSLTPIALTAELNAAHDGYCVLRLPDKHSYKVFNINGKVLGTILPNTVGEKGAYFDSDKLITDFSLEELEVLACMVNIVDRNEKQA